MSRVLIVDSGMRSLAGHNFSYTRAVERALEGRGCQVTVFANKCLLPQLIAASGYHPVFSFGAYDFLPGNGPWRDLAYLYAQSVVFSDELERSLRTLSVDDVGLTFCHTVNDFELLGWKRFLARNEFRGQLMILLRQTPGFRELSLFKKWVHPYSRIKPQCLNAIGSRLGERFTLLTDSAPLSEDYARVFRHRIVTMPIPINEYFLANSESGVQNIGFERNGHVSIGYVGDARPAKGFGLLPDLVRRTLADSRLRARFVIQCPKAASGTAGDLPTDELRALIELEKQYHGEVKLISEGLSEREYADLFRSLDVVLIPYTGGYVESTSGIFAEALALSKPVLVPHGTWMSDQLRHSGGGLEFRKGDSRDLAEKLAALVQQYEEHLHRAQQSSANWRGFHNSQNLADMLIKEARLVASPLRSSTC